MLLLKPIIKDLKQLQLEILQKYNTDYYVTVIFRAGNKKGIEKVIVKAGELIKVIFSNLDLGKKRLWNSEIRGEDIISFAIVDKSNTTIFDTNNVHTYVLTKDKNKLKNDGDTKVQIYKFFSAEDKEKQTSIMMSQIYTALGEPMPEIKNIKPNDGKDAFSDIDWLK